MSTLTTNLSLVKPALTDVADITVINTNMDTLDTAVASKETPTGAQTKATAAQTASTSYTDTKIAALVNASPATLDTLNELAIALGNDPNFAATITALIGLKAPLDSPALTGTPTAPTAVAGTNNTQLATTAFVQAAAIAGGGGAVSSVNTKTGAVVLVPSDIGAATATSVTTHLADTLAHAETASRTIYVATTGSNTVGDGLTVGTAFLTIAKAISTIKKNLQNAVTISIGDGTYNEDVLVEGYYGGAFSAGRNIMVRSTSGIAANCIINSIKFIANSVGVKVYMLTLNTTTKAAVTVDMCFMVYLQNLAIAGVTSSFHGVNVIDGSTVDLSNSAISNRNAAICCANSRIYSSYNTGSSNVIGILATNAGVIGKYDTQPTGTTPESVLAGGVIR